MSNARTPEQKRKRSQRDHERRSQERLRKNMAQVERFRDDLAAGRIEGASPLPGVPGGRVLQ